MLFTFCGSERKAKYHPPQKPYRNFLLWYVAISRKFHIFIAFIRRNVRACSSRKEFDKMAAATPSTPTITHADTLRRFLYCSIPKPKYVVGSAESRNAYIAQNLDFLKEILKPENRDTIYEVIEAVNKENLLPRRETLFVLLVQAVSILPTSVQLAPMDNLFRNKGYQKLLSVIRDDRDYFTFVKFYSKQRKNFSSGLNKVTFKYYSSKDPMVLARDVTRQKRYHGWSHKDVIKLSHGKSDNVLYNVVINYVLFDLNRAIQAAGDVPDAQRILKHLEHAYTLRRSENLAEMPRLIAELNATLIQVPSYQHKKQVVWESVLPYLELGFVIQKLPLLYRYEFLKKDERLHNDIVALLNNSRKVRASQIHPVEVFIGLRNFEKGGKPMDPKHAKYLKTQAGTDVKTEEQPAPKKKTVKSPQITNALNKALITSFTNVRPTKLSYFITIEVSDKMDMRCLKTKNVNCLEAAVLIAMYISRSESDVTVAVFNESSVSVVPHFEKDATVGQLVSKLKLLPAGCAYIPAVFNYAQKKRKKPIDVFLNLVYHNHSLEKMPKELQKEKPIPALNKYRANKNVPDVRMITVSLGTNTLILADGSPHILDICGFDKELPKVIEAFSKKYFL